MSGFGPSPGDLIPCQNRGRDQLLKVVSCVQPLQGRLMKQVMWEVQPDDHGSPQGFKTQENRSKQAKGLTKSATKKEKANTPSLKPMFKPQPQCLCCLRGVVLKLYILLPRASPNPVDSSRFACLQPRGDGRGKGFGHPPSSCPLPLEHSFQLNGRGHQQLSQSEQFSPKVLADASFLLLLNGLLNDARCTHYTQYTQHL